MDPNKTERRFRAYLLLEGDSFLYEGLGEGHGVLEVHVVVPRAVDEVQLQGDHPRMTSAKFSDFLLPSPFVHIWYQLPSL